MKKNVLILAFLSAALFGCQLKPTEVRETTAPISDEGPTASAVLARDPAILDAREAIDFGVSHVPGAINVDWRDFTVPGARQKGLLESDSFALARRLSLWGIDPSRPVLVISERGSPEGGWIGWMLKTLGVETVTLGTPEVFRGQLARPQGPPENKPLWKPSVRTELIATPDEGRAFLRGPAVIGPFSTRARTQALQGARLPPKPEIRRVVLDVRAPAERAKMPVKLFSWAGPVFDVEWTRFMMVDGRPSSVGVDALKTAGLDGTEEILVVSEEGLESGAVVFALDELGFGRPRNLSGGLRAVGARK